MISRREFLLATACALPPLLQGATRRFDSLAAALARLERHNGGRLGVSVLDTASAEHAGYRADERFAMCSTFKFLLAAAVLQRVDRDQENPQRLVSIPSAPLIAHSPLSAPHAGGAMSVAQLCQAILIQSDNTAANLLLESIGGPAGLTNFARSLGDTVTRLDRWELELNEALAGDVRDTTSPDAMTSDLKAILLGDVLSSGSRNQLTEWMVANQTGLDRLRANLPPAWRVADKTGNNSEHTSNDIAVIWPAGKPPLIVCAYITQCPGPDAKRASMLARIGELVRRCIQ
jgi:beta-lactamase class A